MLAISRYLSSLVIGIGMLISYAQTTKCVGNNTSMDSYEGIHQNISYVCLNDVTGQQEAVLASSIDATTTLASRCSSINISGVGSFKPMCKNGLAMNDCSTSGGYAQWKTVECDNPNMKLDRSYMTTYDLFYNRNEERNASGTLSEKQFYRGLEDYTMPVGINNRTDYGKGNNTEPDDYNANTNTNQPNSFLKATQEYDTQLGGSNITQGDPAQYDPAGQFQVRHLIKKLLRALQKYMFPIAVLIIVIGAIQMAISMDPDKTLSEQVNVMTSIGTGLLVFTFAITLVDKIFFGRIGEVFRLDMNGNGMFERAKDFATQIIKELAGMWYIDPISNQTVIQWGGILAYLESFIIPIAVLYIVIHAFRLSKSTDSGAISSSANSVVSVLGGIFIFYTLRYIINFFTYNPRNVNSQFVQEYRPIISPTETQAQVISYLTQWGNYVIGFLGIIGVLMIIYGGARMVMSYVSPDGQKMGREIVMTTVIGLILAFSSFVIIRYFAVPFDRMAGIV